MQINELTVTGNLTKDPELKYTPSGAAVCNLYIAINHTYKIKNESKQEVVFINVVIWGKEAEYIDKTVVKGNELLVIGRLVQSSWEDKEGKKITKTEIRANHVIPTPNIKEGD